ncbi:MAG: hypothetical protein WAO71_11140 [Gallionella sp.]
MTKLPLSLITTFTNNTAISGSLNLAQSRLIRSEEQAVPDTNTATANLIDVRIQQDNQR